MCTLKNKKAVSSEWIQLFYQVGHHGHGIFSGFLDSVALAKVMLTMEGIKVTNIELLGETLY